MKNLNTEERPGDVLTLKETTASADARMTALGLGYKVLAAAMIGLGLLGMQSGDFAGVWQRIPLEHLPWRPFFAYSFAVVELACGIGLLFRRSAAMAARVLGVFLLSWAVLLKLPAIVAMPNLEATWLGLAEITVMLAGAWAALLALAGAPGRRRVFGLAGARALFALSLLPIGLAHFFYVEQTAALVPSWLHWQAGWAYLTGAGSIAACLAVLSGLGSRLAATLEAAMLAIITLLVWTPGLTPSPNGFAFQVTAFLISTAIAAGAWTVADSYRGTPWFAVEHLRGRS
jgi:uncharacterized membrane protein